MRKFLPVLRNVMNIKVNNYEVDSSVGSRDMGNQVIFVLLMTAKIFQKQ